MIREDVAFDCFYYVNETWRAVLQLLLVTGL